MKILKYVLLVVALGVFSYVVIDNFSFIILKSYNTQGSHLTWQ